MLYRKISVTESIFILIIDKYSFIINNYIPSYCNIPIENIYDNYIITVHISHFSLKMGSLGEDGTVPCPVERIF